MKFLFVLCINVRKVTSGLSLLQSHGSDEEAVRTETADQCRSVFWLQVHAVMFVTVCTVR